MSVHEDNNSFIQQWKLLDLQNELYKSLNHLLFSELIRICVDYLRLYLEKQISQTLFTFHFLTELSSGVWKYHITFQFTERVDALAYLTCNDQPSLSSTTGVTNSSALVLSGVFSFEVRDESNVPILSVSLSDLSQDCQIEQYSIFCIRT
jgi:hypothetical protein